MYSSAMRIACVFAPHVPLQALVRRRPELRKQPVAVVSGGPASSVLACSRAAYAMGVRVGMSAIAARQLSEAGAQPELQIELRDLEAEAQLEVAMVEALYGLSSRVEADGLRREQQAREEASRKAAATATAGLGMAGFGTAGFAGFAGLGRSISRGVDRGVEQGRGARGPSIGRGVAEPAVAGGATLFAEVPTGMRGATFGARILEVAAALDVAVRIGIADDRFTAWVAARHGHSDDAPVVAVPRGGSAAFLAPQPLALLDISPEVLQMLVALGVRTLGEFASLPAPSVARRWDCDLQALARGEGGSALFAVKPATGPLREEVCVGGELSLGAAVARLAERVALRLAGRGGVAAAMELTTHAESGAESVTLWLVPPLAAADALADRIGRAVSEGAEGSVQRLAIAVTVGFPAEEKAEEQGGAPAEAQASERAPATQHRAFELVDLDRGLPEPVTMSGALLRWSEASAAATAPSSSAGATGVAGVAGVGPHDERRLARRPARRGKQRRRLVPTQARLFGAE